jgi:predicted ArsR family transcriptional regulator
VELLRQRISVLDWAMPARTRDAQVASVAALGQPLRRELYALISAKDEWVGRDEAAEALGVPRSVAAFHLDKLTGAGLLQVRYQRPAGRGGPGAGRPAKIYRRADIELSVSLPERQYDLAGALLSDAVQASTQTGCPVSEALATAARREGTAAGVEARAGLPTRTSTKSLRRATIGALERFGYEPRERDDEIILANCPFHQLAERHCSLICGMNLDLISGLTEGLDGEDRLVPRLEPAPGMCCVRIRSRQGQRP